MHLSGLNCSCCLSCGLAGTDALWWFCTSEIKANFKSHWSILSVPSNPWTHGVAGTGALCQKETRPPREMSQLSTNKRAPARRKWWMAIQPKYEMSRLEELFGKQTSIHGRSKRSRYDLITPWGRVSRIAMRLPANYWVQPGRRGPIYWHICCSADD